MREELNPQELALLNSVEDEYARIKEKRAAVTAMLMASRNLGPSDTIDLKTGEVKRFVSDIPF